MSAALGAPVTAGEDVAPLGRLLLQHDVEQFLYEEARLLDERLGAQWLDLLSDGIRYWLPARTDRTFRERHLEVAGDDDVAVFDDDKATLAARVARLETGMAWSEDPPSRTRHLVTNVVVRERDDGRLDVRSCFLVYRTRGRRTLDIWAGKRDDVLSRRPGGTFVIDERVILLDQGTILSQNLSVLF